MRKLFFLSLVLPVFAACNNGVSAVNVNTGKSAMPELVGFMSKSWYDAHKDKLFNITTYKAFINGTPALAADFDWRDDFLYLKNATHVDTAGLAPDFRAWYIKLFPAAPAENEATTFLIRDADDESKFEDLKIKNVKIINGKYFDIDGGQPFELELIVDGYPPIIVKGVKK